MGMRRRSRARRIKRVRLVAAVVGAAAVAFACGARTGLLVPTGDEASVGVDAGRDARRDVGRDVGVDVAIDSYVKPPPGLDCAEAGVTYIYVIGDDNGLYAFHPDSGDFELKGVIHCPVPEGSTPFSMAVDHLGVAYVVFYDGSTIASRGNGSLFRVSTANASCEPTPFVPGQEKIVTFGMGFAANPVAGGVAGETLYIAGDEQDSLATIDVNTFKVTTIGPLGSIDGIHVFMSELTGTGTGGLYGFFSPEVGGMLQNEGPTYIVQLDTKTGGVLSGVELPDDAEGEGWAFGFWGGDFYTFTAPESTDYTTVVTRYRPSDGSIVEVAMAPPNVQIVGAGVSTCAPQE